MTLAEFSAARLTRRLEMARAVAAGESPVDVALRFGVSRTLVWGACAECGVSPRQVADAANDVRRAAIKVSIGTDQPEFGIRRWIGPPPRTEKCWQVER